MTGRWVPPIKTILKLFTKRKRYFVRIEPFSAHLAEHVQIVDGHELQIVTIWKLERRENIRGTQIKRTQKGLAPSIYAFI